MGGGGGRETDNERENERDRERERERDYLDHMVTPICCNPNVYVALI